MNFIEDKIINILKNLPNESNYLDYKQIPYFKDGLYNEVRHLEK